MNMRFTVLNTGRRVCMTHKLLHAVLIAAALQVVLHEVAVAQINMQQMPGLQAGTSHGQSASGTASAVHSSGLGIVPEDFPQLKLAPGFLVELKVLDDSDFQGDFRVDQEGNVALPI